MLLPFKRARNARVFSRSRSSYYLATRWSCSKCGRGSARFHTSYTRIANGKHTLVCYSNEPAGTDEFTRAYDLGRR